MYSKGEGVPPNYAEGVKWVERARKTAEEGDAEMQFKMGVGYHKMKYHDEAEKWYEMAAEKGHAETQYELGCMYANGEGVRQNYDKAAKWFWKVAEQVDDESPQFEIGVRLGLMYSGGKGVPENDVEAYDWFRLAQENVHEEVSKEFEEALSRVISSHAAILTAEL